MKAESSTPLYLIWSNEHNAWWRPNSCGYTTFIESAGRYSKAEAEDICSWARSPVSNQIVPPEVMIEESVALEQMGSDPDVEAFEKLIGARKATQAEWAALVKERDTWREIAERLDRKLIEEQTDHNKTVDRLLLLRDKLILLEKEYCALRIFIDSRLGGALAIFDREKEKDEAFLNE